MPSSSTQLRYLRLFKYLSNNFAQIGIQADNLEKLGRQVLPLGASEAICNHFQRYVAAM